MSVLLILLLCFVGYLIYMFGMAVYRVHRVVRNVRKATGFSSDRGTRRQRRSEEPRRRPRRRPRRKIPKEYAVDAVWQELEIRGDEEFLQVYRSDFTFRQEAQISEADYEIIS